MKKVLLTIMALTFIMSAKAQQADTSENNPNQVFTFVEKEPGFKGGMQNFYDYLTLHLRYPPNAVKNRIQGKVFLTFVVEKDGSLSDVKVVRGVSEEIDAEAVAVLRNSPKWSPGIQNGRPVRVQYTVPINFKLPPLPDTSTSDTTKIFTAVEQIPSFPGGIDNFFRYLQKNIRYPANAYANNVQGRVYLTFVVEKDGSLTSIKVIRSVSDDIDAEAIRVMKNSPNWNPGMQNGRPVRVQFTMPISFTLSN